MPFKHFKYPEQYASYLEGETECTVCGLERPCFDGSGFFGDYVVESICADCLAAGELKDQELTTVNGDENALKEQLRNLHPDWPERERNGGRRDLGKYARKKNCKPRRKPAIFYFGLSV